jgi:hypothetical protein
VQDAIDIPPGRQKALRQMQKHFALHTNRSLFAGPISEPEGVEGFSYQWK